MGDSICERVRQLDKMSEILNPFSLKIYLLSGVEMQPGELKDEIRVLVSFSKTCSLGKEYTCD